MKRVMLGNHAVAYGVKACRVEVIAGYPITPQTPIMEKLAELCSTGELRAKFIPVESEHSAMAACIAAASVGVRTFTATSSQGLGLMHELLHWAAGARLPIVMVNVNRAMAPPWNLSTDQNDSLSQRNTGWLQFYCESNQEVIDTMIQAYRISERVMLPTMVNMDAFVLSHISEPVEIPDQELVDSYLPPYEPEFKLDVDDPHTFGAGSDLYINFRYKIQQAMGQAKEVVGEEDRNFRALFGRGYGFMGEYHCEDAELILVTSGTISGTARAVVDELRGKGQRVGVLKMRLFRPFPKEEVRRALKGVPKVAVIDRNISFGHSGIFAQEIKSALYDGQEGPQLFGFIAGLGGKDITPEDILRVIDYTLTHEEPEEDAVWVGVRGEGKDIL